MSELKPCPFCGKEAELRIYKRKRVYRDAPRMGKLSTARVTNIELKTEKQRRRGKVIDVQMTMYTVEWDEYVVTCPDTNCYARNTTRSCREYDKAAERWNKRYGECLYEQYV